MDLHPRKHLVKFICIVFHGAWSLPNVVKFLEKSTLKIVWDESNTHILLEFVPQGFLVFTMTVVWKLSWFHDDAAWPRNWVVTWDTHLFSGLWTLWIHRLWRTSEEAPWFATHHGTQGYRVWVLKSIVNHLSFLFRRLRTWWFCCLSLSNDFSNSYHHRVNRRHDCGCGFGIEVVLRWRQMRPEFVVELRLPLCVVNCPENLWGIVERHPVICWFRSWSWSHWNNKIETTSGIVVKVSDANWRSRRGSIDIAKITLKFWECS